MEPDLALRFASFIIASAKFRRNKEIRPRLYNLPESTPGPPHRPYSSLAPPVRKVVNLRRKLIRVLMMRAGNLLSLSRKMMVLSMMMGSPSFLLCWMMKMVIQYKKMMVLSMMMGSPYVISVVLDDEDGDPVQESDRAIDGDLVPSKEVEG
ncbi:hypothetical protein OIU74_015185 [Salix koriyanagi]|uniref:Uncharacterized protein n=1 Tax=Salix koriyanagi TaxID=2511006 RepID=A0A9Q0PY79_9ROSI|nr:hypothetical protein OIU74_015185 [Salix koriyanagi]